MKRDAEYWATFAKLASCTALPFALLSSWLLSLILGMHFGFVLRYGIVSGLVFGLVVAFAMAPRMKAVRISVPVQNSEEFWAVIDLALAEFGYRLERRELTYAIYKSSWHAGLLAGAVTVRTENKSATIVGPASYLQRLQTRIKKMVNA
jgi:hypothetical protein